VNRVPEIEVIAPSMGIAGLGLQSGAAGVPPAVAEKRLSLAWSRTMRSQKRFALCLVPRVNYILIVFPLFPMPQILFYQEFRVHEYLQGSTYLITIGGLLGAE